MDDSAGLEMNQFGCLGTGCPVKVMCKGGATCAFSNIANLCYHLTDEIAGDFLRKSDGYYVVALKSTNSLVMRHVVSIADGYIID
eukprot:6844594-Ditylum_brightwellii.AAC.1